MRSANSACRIYPALNRDLLLAGALLHDCGHLESARVDKIGYGVSTEIQGELLGHIPLGIELINRLWKEILDEAEKNDIGSIEPNNQKALLHLLHLIASHHGHREFRPGPPRHMPFIISMSMILNTICSKKPMPPVGK
jgi:3'-5' exoribonuclease